MVYCAPSTPPRSRANRSTSVSTGTSLSPFSGLIHRASPRQRAPRGGDGVQAGHDARTAYDEGKRRRRRVLSLRRILPERWKAMLVVGFGLTTLLYGLLQKPERPPLVIPKRHYVLQRYRHLNSSKPVSLRPATRILHVTKEFGPATMGGLGVMLTALSIAQSESPYLSISVALPHYSYLRDRYSPDEVRPFANLSIPLTTNPSRGKTSSIRVPVSLLRWTYSSAVDFLNPDAPLDTPSTNSSLSRSIDIYLIGPSETKPFTAAFRAKDEGDIYSAYKPLKQEWKDLYFARAVTELVSYLGAKDEATVFEDELDSLEGEEVEEELERLEEGKKSARRRVDVVHLHGATNAVLAHFLRKREREHRFDEPHSRHPAIVYTLHDSLDEVEYSNLVENVRHFLPPSPPPSAPSTLSASFTPLQPYVYRSNTQLFTSSLGIDLADAVTFVSRSIAADIVSGRFRFYLEDLVMPSISKRAAEGAFIGVTNGLDFTERSKNPFTAPSLVERGLAFPRVGADVLVPEMLYSSAGTRLSFIETKQRAKDFLVSHLPSLFNHPDDASRPWFLFIGRYQYNKGCQFFCNLLDVLSSTSSPSHPQGRLILLGARNNYPFSALQSLARHYPRHLILIDDVSTPGIQAEWGTLIRMASDFSVVPSLSEAFGLVAAEGLLFGSPVLSTGVGGLREFLIPFPEGELSMTSGNAYLFDLFPNSASTSGTQGAEEDYSRSAQDIRPSEEQLEPARMGLRRAAERALEDWRMRQEGDREEGEMFVRRMVADALELKWNRENGPIEEYIRVYDLALSNRRGRLGLPRSIPAPLSSAEEDDSPSSARPAAHPRPPPFLVPPLRRVLDPPVAVPHIVQGGHDQVSGSDGLANLLARREEELEREEEERREDLLDELEELGAGGGGLGRRSEEGGRRRGNVLPIVKIWDSGEALKAKEALVKEARARRRRKEAKEAAKLARKGKKDGGKKAVLRKTLEKVAKRKRRSAT